MDKVENTNSTNVIVNDNEKTKRQSDWQISHKLQSKGDIQTYINDKDKHKLYKHIY